MRKFVLGLLLVFVSGVSVADEGMWLPLLINKNYEDMKKKGLQLTPEQIYNVNNASLKDAIVSLGGFCTGEIISKEGLLLTNHHCAYNSIQKHSSVENDYLTNGFWAKSKEDEKPNEGLYARFLVRMENVTERILNGISDTTAVAEREVLITKRSTEIANEAEKDTFYDATVKPLFAGNEYYLFVYETYKDVRLVGAPPSSIGKFGGDTDNWMWPRHTGDFALFRIYMSQDGKPAAYSPTNIPLKPKHYLPVSLDGVKEGDFAMVMGFPGRTSRYLTSYGIRFNLDVSNESTIKILGKALELMKQDMDKSDNIRIMYASKYASLSNTWKYLIGQTKNLKDLNVEDKKELLEKEFVTWQSGKFGGKYQNVLWEFSDAYNSLKKYQKNVNYNRYLKFISGSYSLGVIMADLEKKISNPDEKLKPALASAKQTGETTFKYYNPETDRKILAAIFEQYFQEIPKDQHPEFFNIIEKKYKGDFAKWANEAYATSVLSDKTRFEEFLALPSPKILKNDLLYQAILSFSNNYNKKYASEVKKYTDIIAKNEKLVVEGFQLMKPDKVYYPDANSTLRLTYGTVGGYNPADGVLYKHYTTLKGAIDKEDQSNPEFNVPSKLTKLYENKDYGIYGSDGIMYCNFLSNNDITGGNSGSPVINAKGELIGTAFDGNWEAMSGDIAFEPQIQRTISVDIRYTLFIIDKFAGASHLIDELTIITNVPAGKPAEKVKESTGALN